MKASNKGILEWIRKNQIRTNKGLPVEFYNHGFLHDYIADTHNRIVVRKCTQVGASFSTNIKMLHLGDQAPLTTIYTLPTSSEAKNFVLTKFDPMVERSPGLLKMVEKVVLRNQILYNTVVKRIGESYYFFRGSWTTWGAQSIDADVLVVDELDFQKPDVRNMWEERTEGSSSLDIVYWIGYPSIPNYGIEELYQSSDQRKWFIECGHCFKRQTLEWPESIDLKNEKYICRLCGKELTDDMRRKGIWKVTNPVSSNVHGYWINKLMAPWIPASKIIDRFKKDTPKKFHNYTLGLPFVSSESELTDDIIQNSLIDEQEYAMLRGIKDAKIVMGIDQGDIFHMLVALALPDQVTVVAAEMLSSEEEVKKRLAYYSPDMVVMDMFPNRHSAKNLCQHYGTTKFMMAKERNWLETSRQRGHWTVNRSTSEVGVERTESIDAMMEFFIKGAIKFRRIIPRLMDADKKNPGVINQIRNMVPDTQQRHGRMRRVWKAVGPDHYGHALNFVIVACNLLFPGWHGGQTVIPASQITTIKNRMKPWYVKDFEERINQLCNNDTIIIKPGGETKEPDEIVPVGDTIF